MVALLLSAALLLKYLEHRRKQQRVRGPGRKRYTDMPHAGWWYLWLHTWDTRNAARKLYDAYKQHGLVKVLQATLLIRRSDAR